VLNGFSESEKSQNNEGGEMIEYTVKVHDNGAKLYYMNGKYHRDDGAAIEYADGKKEWWLNGEEVTEEEHRRLTNKARELTVQEISDLLGYEVKVVK